MKDKTTVLAFIKKCIRAGNIFWTYHVNMRMMQRGIFRKTIVNAIATYEIIEEYPTDKYLPSYLVYLQHEGSVFHVLIATDIKEANVRIITAYRPNPDEWTGDLKTRRSI